MSDLDRWLETAKSTLQQWRVQLNRLAPGPAVDPEQLSSEDPSTRWRAVRRLQGHPNPQLLPRLIALSNDPDELVRAAVVQTLVSWGPNIVLAPVQKALADHPQPASAAALLEVLAHLPDVANRPVVVPWLTDEDVAVRAAAYMALAALCNDTDLPRLQQALAEDDLPVRQAIMAALCAPEAGPLAAKAASSSDPILNQRAVQAAYRIQRNLDAKRKAEQRAQKKQARSKSAPARPEPPSQPAPEPAPKPDAPDAEGESEAPSQSDGE